MLLSVVISSTLLLITFAISAFAKLPGDSKPKTRSLKPTSVRCYCDHPRCVADSYICESRLGKCYSRKADESAPMMHGCVDDLADQNVCDGVTGDLVRTSTNVDGSSQAFVMCCVDELCNYGKKNRRASYRSTTRRPSLHYRPAFIQNITDRNPTPASMINNNNNNADNSDNPSGVWFRAAVIAVPICGGVVLLVLVVIAVRILRGDKQPLPGVKQTLTSSTHPATPTSHTAAKPSRSHTKYRHQLLKTVAEHDIESGSTTISSHQPRQQRSASQLVLHKQRRHRADMHSLSRRPKAPATVVLLPDQPHYSHVTPPDPPHPAYAKLPYRDFVQYSPTASV